ncbi:MAG: alpha/beta hydrolase [Chloroflexota bacterium]|nr:alpha/beta hydrolase [Chloroflexota bacterium]
MTYHDDTKSDRFTLGATSRRNLLAGGTALAAGGLLSVAGLPGLGARPARAQDGTPAPGGTPEPLPSAVPIDPQMQEVLDELAALTAIPIESQNPFNARQLPLPADAVVSLLSKRGEPAQELVGGVTHELVSTPNGDLVTRVYTPEGEGPFPILVYFHGGGWVIANLNTYDSSCRALCNAAQAVVVSVAYRQAPENPFPAAADDAYFAFQAIAQTAPLFGGDADRVAVAGESAGGNLATVTSMIARDQGGIMPVHQLLVYPVTTFLPEGEAAESIVEHATAQPLGRPLLEWFGEFYIPSEADRQNPYASPLLADDLSGLPPATVILAEIDPLRSQGELYAAALEAAGVDVELTTYQGVTHEFFGMGAVVDIANDAVMQAAGRLQAAFSDTGTPTP